MIIIKTRQETLKVLPYTDDEQINKLRAVIKTYFFEAMEVEKAGLEVKTKKTSESEVPQEIEEAFKINHVLETASYNLPPGRLRGYFTLLHTGKAIQNTNIRN